jgi:hypothetical protein
VRDSVNGGFFRLSGLGRANAGYQQLTRRIALLAGFCQRNLWVGAEGQTIFLTFKTVAEIPQLRAAGGYRQVQTLCIGELVGFCEGFAARILLSVNMRVSPFIELNDPQSDPKFSGYVGINQNASGKIFTLTY